MADNNKKNNDDLTLEDVVVVVGAMTAQNAPIIGAIAGSLLVADLCMFGGIATAILAICIKDKRDGQQK